jgi:hypothetical protein
MNTKVDF